MNTDEHGYFDALTERVPGAVFEKVYQRAQLHELRVEEVLVRTDRAVSQLFASLGPESVSARQSP